MGVHDSSIFLREKLLELDNITATLIQLAINIASLAMGRHLLGIYY